MLPQWGHRFPRCVLLVGLLALSTDFPGASTSVWADRPSAMKLFPEETLLFIRMRNAKEFGERLRDSSTGRMLRDPQLQPFVEDVYGRVGEAYTEKAEAFLGVSWEDLQKLPQGEVAFAIVDRIGLTPAFLLLVDQGQDRSEAAQKLLDRALEAAAEKGGDFSSEKIGDVEVTVVRDNEKPDRMLGLFERENTIVLATDADVLRNVLWHWDNAGGEAVSSETSAAADESGEKDSENARVDESVEGDSGEGEEDAFIPGRTLAENADFATLLRNCRRPQDPPPHAILYANPIGLFQGFSRNNTGAGIAVGFLPQLGLDGVLAIGGTVTFATGPYDDLAHYHILLANPRSGVLQLLTFESGETTPEPFVPYATENYYTGRWNAVTFYDRLQEMIDNLLGEGTFEKQAAERAREFLDSDVRDDVIAHLTGRFSLITGYEKPAHLRSQKHTLALELSDEAKARETLERFMKKHPEQFEDRSFGNVKYHAITPEWWKEMDEDERPFNAFVAIMDGYFFIGGSCQLFEEIIAARDGTIQRLAESDDYARITAALGEETAGATPALFMVQRAEESIRHLYELMTSEKSRQYMEEHAEENPVWAALSESLQEHQLPPFDTLIQYYGPGGGILYDTDSGYHGIGFTLRNETGP